MEDQGSPSKPVAELDALAALEAVTIATSEGPLTYLRSGWLGPPLVLLNALGQGIAPWSRLLAELSPRRVLIWEMRRQDTLQRPFQLDRHAEDLTAIRHHESVDTCHLVGWCTGPKVALRHCLLGGGSGVRSMVFLNGAFKHPGRSPDLDTTYERNLESVCRAVDRRPLAAARLMHMLGSDDGRSIAGGDGGVGDAPAPVPAALMAAVRKPFANEMTFINYARQHLDFWCCDPLPAAAGLDIPMLFVGCENDAIVSAAGVRLAAAGVPAASYAEIAGGTHHALFERSAAVGDLIESFGSAQRD